MTEQEWKRRRNRFLGGLPGILILGIAAAIAWNNGVGEQFVPKRWIELDPGFFRSAQLHPRLIQRVLDENEIRVIVDLTPLDLSSRPQRAEEAAAAEFKIAHHRFPLDGSGLGDIGHYADAIEVIAAAREEGLPVLVHCSAGARRAGGVVASYQVLVEGRGTEAAYAELDRYGRIPVSATPLVAYLNQNMQMLAVELASRGVIERVPSPLPKFVEPD